MKKRTGGLLTNTIMLYILTFSNYFFNFITVPYQTRILGPINYGRLGFATAFMVYVQLFLDFGFLLSATEEVTNHRNDKKRISQIFTTVCCCKLILIFSCFFIFLRYLIHIRTNTAPIRSITVRKMKIILYPSTPGLFSSQFPARSEQNISGRYPMVEITPAALPDNLSGIAPSSIIAHVMA